MSSAMTWSLDARTPVRLLDDATQAPPGAVVLAEDGAPLPAGASRVERYATPVATPHPIGCACCQPRNPASIALDRLFPDELLQGGYRKKYLRAVSRLTALARQAGADAV